MASSASDEFDPKEIEIRLATEEDFRVVRQLYSAGLLEGQVPENDTGADMENLEAAYLADDGQSGFWVAAHRGQIVGMVGVQHTADESVEVRRLRVREGYRRKGLGTRLMEKALTFCQHHGYLKIVLDVRIERAPAISMFENFGFKLTRTREVAGRKLLDFYLDLYRDPTG